MKKILLLAILTPWAAIADFQKSWEEPIIGTTALDVALGDIDGDGDSDACIIHLLDPGTVLLNDGNGNFTPSPTAIPLPQGGAAGLALLNNDAHLDLFVAGHLSDCKVYYNDGSGNFTDSGQSIGGNESRSGLLLADINGDTYIDAVLPTNSTTVDNEIWLNDGNGVFTDSGASLGTYFSRDVELVNVDPLSDSDLDLVFANNGQNKIWLNNGSNTFTESALSLGANTTFDIAFADLNGDTYPDAWLANGFNPPFEQPDEVWFNDGTGTFTKSTQVFSDAYSVSVVLVDVNNDTFIDAVVGTNNTMPNEIWLNDGSGSFTLSPSTLGQGSAFDIEVANLDMDTDLDFFLAINGNPSEVWKTVSGPSGPVADTGQRLGSSQAACIAHGDFNGDNNIDVAIGSVGGVIRVLQNNGAGQFSDSDQFLSNGFGNNNSALVAAHLDGDSHLDLFAVNSPQGGAADLADRVWLNDGTGNFTVSPTTYGAENGGAVLILDVDGVNGNDVIVGNAPYNSAVGQNRILLNNGSGVFTGSDALGTGNTRALAAADLDGNPGLDIFVGNLNEANTIWFNNGSGTFTDSGQSLGTNGTYRVLLEDFNGDTYIDAFCANISGGNKLWLNDGSGTFTDSGLSLGSLKARDAAAFDANDDTHLDIWVGNGFTGSESDQLWLGDGAGNFTLETNFESRRTYGLAAFDFNNDGDTDVFAASGDGDHVAWAQGGTMIAAYAASFGLTGDDTLPFADPDLDGVLNYEEMAFNLNPAVADKSTITNLATDTKGLPRIMLDTSGVTPKFVAETIRRIGSTDIDYRLEAGPGFPLLLQPAASVVTSPINTDYERATYEFTPTGTAPTQFGRFAVFYSP